MSLPADILAWTERFSAAVRGREQQAARALFADDVRGFGTVARAVDDLPSLARDQWSVVWPMTRDFSFEAESLGHQLSDDGRTAIVTGLWSSRRLSDNLRRDGRATLVLTKDAAGNWLATHTHFSLTPSDGGALA